MGPNGRDVSFELVAPGCERVNTSFASSGTRAATYQSSNGERAEKRKALLHARHPRRGIGTALDRRALWGSKLGAQRPQRRNSQIEPRQEIRGGGNIGAAAPAGRTG